MFSFFILLFGFLMNGCEVAKPPMFTVKYRGYYYTCSHVERSEYCGNLELLVLGCNGPISGACVPMNNVARMVR